MCRSFAVQGVFTVTENYFVVYLRFQRLFRFMRVVIVKWNFKALYNTLVPRTILIVWELFCSENEVLLRRIQVLNGRHIVIRLYSIALGRE